VLAKLDKLKKEYKRLSELINSSEIISDRDTWNKYLKEYNIISPVIEKYKLYEQTKKNIEQAKIILQDDLDLDLKTLAKEELKENNILLEKIMNEIKILLLPEDVNDKKNVIIEIRAGAGGNEAALFAGDLFRMYSHYAESQNWRTEILSINENELGGFKEIICMIKGRQVYSKLKYESGVHRVQRIPVTESNGRIHTSTVTVAILPEAEEIDIEINQNDLRIDVFRSSGNGGQSVNTTDSAVRVTHLPTGIVISCQDEKSQLKNKDRAINILRAKLYDLECAKQNQKLSSERKNQVGTGDRSERIRTYNFPQGRVTDHRINLTLHRLENILNGDLKELIENLIMTDQAKKLSGDL